MTRRGWLLVVNPEFDRASGVSSMIERLYAGTDATRWRVRFLDAGCGTTAPAWMPTSSWSTAPLMGRSLLRTMRALASLRRHHRLRGYELIHVHHRRLLVWFQLVRWLGGYRFRLIYTGHSCAAPSRLFRLFLPARGTSVVGPAVAQTLRETGFAGPIHVLGNPVPFPLVPPNSLPDVRRVVVVARLDRNKAHACLLRAWRRLRDQGIDAVLDIVGDGPCASELRAQVEADGLSTCVRFIGFDAAVAERYAQALFAVLPTRVEGLPTVAVEAAAAGRATLMTAVAGCRPCVPTDAALPNLIAVDDDAALAAALATWLADPVATRSEGARFFRHHRARFRAEVVAARLDLLYRQGCAVAINSARRYPSL